MVELKVTLGAKGQVVIPKIFRDYFKLYPKQPAIIKSTEEGVLILKKDNRNMDIIEQLMQTAIEASKRRKGKPFVYKKEEFYEQHDKRAKRAGL